MRSEAPQGQPSCAAIAAHCKTCSIFGFISNIS